MSIKDLYQRLVAGETIHATNTENSVEFDVEAGTLGSTPVCVVTQRGVIKDRYVLDQRICDDWQTRIDERG